MSEPFLGEIKIWSLGFAPTGWALCNGQTMAINQNTALFSLLGTYYGGDGFSTFRLPDLQGKVVVGAGTGPGTSTYLVGQTGGEAAHTLTVAEIPQHTHPVKAATVAGTSVAPAAGSTFAADGSTHPTKPYNSATAAGPAMAPTSIQPAGNSQPHENQMPYLVLNFCIALAGIFPSRN